MTLILASFCASLAGLSLYVHAQFLKGDRIMAAHEINSTHVKALATNADAWLGSVQEWSRHLAARGNDIQAIRRWLESQTEVLGFAVYRPTADAHRWQPVVAERSIAYQQFAGEEPADVERVHASGAIPFARILSKENWVTLGRAGGQPVLFFALAQPDGESVAVLDLRPDRLLKLVSREYLPGTAVSYLVDSQGRVVAHPDPERVVRTMTFDDVPIVRTVFATPGALHLQAFVWAGESWFGAGSSTRLGGLIAVSQVTESDVLGPVRALSEKAALFALLGLTAAILISAWFFGRPEFANAIGTEPAPAPHKHHEPVEVAGEFLNLLKSIHQRIEQIRAEEPEESDTKSKLEGLSHQAAWAAEIFDRLRRIPERSGIKRTEAPQKETGT